MVLTGDPMYTPGNVTGERIKAHRQRPAPRTRHSSLQGRVPGQELRGTRGGDEGHHRPGR
ncbi:hypothetical protein [Demequina litorisediminis]|uniref:hypothetical protein n=1 Tax=Demequina litorisediminis TaxID=1849022 RepID=UPI0032AF9D33